MNGRTNDDATQIVTAAQQDVLDEHAKAIRKLAERSIADILEIGRRLTEAKQALGRGHFVSWIEREFRWSEDTAERLIAIHALQRRIPEVADVSLPITGLYLLAAPSTPPEAVETVVAKARDSEVSVAEIRSTVEDFRSVRKPKLPSYIPTQEAAPKPITPAPTPNLASEPSRKVHLGRAAIAKSKEHLQWFTVACRQYLPDVTVEEHRQEARRLVAELTKDHVPVDPT